MTRAWVKDRKVRRIERVREMRRVGVGCVGGWMEDGEGRIWMFGSVLVDIER